ncbi:MAG: winged helix-turn-helix domain-containing protein, partial [Abditibacteriota bacterium]|nr:winged helix-turn-helix domain-containing protein [Abditibacteriota bacterium]
AEPPTYELLGNGLRVRFKALRGMLKDQNDTFSDTRNDTLEHKILTLLTNNPSLTQKELALITGMSIPSIKRVMKILVNTGRVSRVGSKRAGYWKVTEV